MGQNVEYAVPWEATIGIRPYEEIPQSTKDYADFIANVNSLGLTVPLYGMEDRRIELHEEMLKDYGLRYEYTRVAVQLIGLNVDETTPTWRIAQYVDANLRYIKDHYPQSRTQEELS